VPPKFREPEPPEDTALGGGPSSDLETSRHPEELRRLGFLVEAEAKRALSESQLEGDPQRIADGWERRFIADRPRAEEAIELYAGLGYEVCADPIMPEELADDCEDCLLVAQLRFVTIYTRRPSRQSDERTTED
jgi:hypothetical protein